MTCYRNGPATCGGYYDYRYGSCCTGDSALGTTLWITFTFLLCCLCICLCVARAKARQQRQMQRQEMMMNAEANGEMPYGRRFGQPATTTTYVVPVQTGAFTGTGQPIGSSYQYDTANQANYGYAN